ncbi:MAG: M28 family peptidase [Actinomycetia bacterium]|nr:M28 family peptidase [Actinomycetes bacterium]
MPSRTPNVMMPMIIAMLALVAVCVTRGIVPGGTGMWIPTGVVQGIASLVLLVAALTFLDIGTGHYVPGAIDNATGTAASLSVADAIAREPLSNCSFEFLALGCEESIMMGMVQYARRHFKEMDRENTYIINLDSVGCGPLPLRRERGIRPDSALLSGTDQDRPPAEGVRGVPGDRNLCASFHKYGVVSRAPRRRSCKARDRAVLREYREGAERSRCGCIDVRMQAYLRNGVLSCGGKPGRARAARSD